MRIYRCVWCKEIEAIIIFILGNLGRFQRSQFFHLGLSSCTLVGCVPCIWQKKHSLDIRVLFSNTTAVGKLLNLDKFHIPI